MIERIRSSALIRSRVAEECPASMALPMISAAGSGPAASAVRRKVLAAERAGRFLSALGMRRRLNWTFAAGESSGLLIASPCGCCRGSPRQVGQKTECEETKGPCAGQFQVFNAVIWSKCSVARRQPRPHASAPPFTETRDHLLNATAHAAPGKSPLKGRSPGTARLSGSRIALRRRATWYSVRHW